MSVHTPLTPMRASGIQHQVARVYREGGPHQWVRETLMNALEADAQRIEFGIEWQAVESRGIYRRLVADDGVGMTPEQLVRFFNTWGGGGKPIGGIHENFGIGAKSSLLPWNRCGLVVISWVDGESSMIWVMADGDTGEYGLRNFEAATEGGDVQIAEVVAPFMDEEYGLDWAAVKPDWIKDHGTVVVLLGDQPDVHTMLGDPNRPIEASLTGPAGYLNRRLWEIPDNVRITVEELRHNDPTEWPRTRKEAGGHAGRRTHRRKIEGAKHFIEYPAPASFKRGQLVASGSVDIGHHTEVDWFLWNGDRPSIGSYAAQGGYIAALYRNELYDVTSHHSTYRSFGILEASVRSRVWLVVRPPTADRDWRYGVYPRGDRNSLLIRSSETIGEPLPINDWGAKFAEQMPDAIREAIRQARAGGTGSITDDAWRTRLIERFGSRWRIFKLRAGNAGDFSVAATQPGSKPREDVTAVPETHRGEPEEGGEPQERISGLAGKTNVGDVPGPKVASRHRVGGGIPTWTAVRAEDLGGGMLAAWAPNHPDYAEGAVLINIEHPVIEEEIAHWQSQYPDQHADAIAQEVIAAYGEVAVAKVAHSEHLKSLLPSTVVEDDLRSEAALTMALLGLIGEEAVIAPRVSGKFGRRRAAAQPEEAAA